MQFFWLRIMLPILVVLPLSLTALQAQEEQQEKDPYATRRSMLQAHQMAGLATWALWLATNLQGEQAKASMYRQSDAVARVALLQHPQYGNDPLYAYALRTPDRSSITAAYWLAKDPSNNLPMYAVLKSHDEWAARRADETHGRLGMATVGMYAVTASLAFFAPKGPVVTAEEGIGPTTIHKAMIPFHLLAIIALPTLGRKIEEGGPVAAERMQRTGWAGFTALSIAMFSMAF